MNLDNLFLETSSDDSNLRKLLDRAFETKEETQPLDWQESYFWDADFFNLSDSSAFSHLKESEKKKVLVLLSQNLLSEAYFIELAGMTYASRMVQSSQTIEERMFYSSMGAEEARHFKELLPFIEKQPEKSDFPFVSQIGDIILSAPKLPAILLIQVLLEGWGIIHYGRLKKGCLNKALASVFGRILRDEARHHGGGLLFSKESRLTECEEEYFVSSLESICSMIAMGPATVLFTIKEFTNLSTQDSIKQFLTETDAIPETQMKLDELKNLVKKGVSPDLFDDLTSQGVFLSPNLAEMIRLYL